MALYVIILAVVWVIMAGWVVACILAAGWPEERPAAPDPYAADVAAFSAELADWDRHGRPQA